MKRTKINKKAVKIVSEVKQLCRLLFADKLHDVYLFGSYARGDYDEESDVDILLTLDLTDRQLIKYRKSVSYINSRLSLKYDVTVSTVLVPLKRFIKYANDLPFYSNVINEGINYGFSQ